MISEHAKQGRRRCNHSTSGATGTRTGSGRSCTAALRRGGGFAVPRVELARIITGVVSLHTCGTTCCIPAAGPSALAQQAGDTPQRVPALRPHALVLPRPDAPRARGIPDQSRPRCCPRAPADCAPIPATLLRSRASWPCAPRHPPAHRRRPSAARLGRRLLAW